MALFTDGGFATIEDLTAQDSGLLGVVGAEAIDTTKKLALAHEEVGVELGTLLPRVGSGLESVVVTPPLRMWLVFKTLELVYRDAYFSQLNDRYREKRDEYRRLAKWAAEKLLETGVGLAADPVRRADAPEVAKAAGGLAQGKYFASVTWVNATGEEGAPGNWSSVVLEEGEGLTVRAVNAPSNATGWNVYVGTGSEDMKLQNAELLAPGVTWTAASALLTNTREAGTGQVPSYTRTIPRVLERG